MTFLFLNFFIYLYEQNKLINNKCTITIYHSSPSLKQRMDALSIELYRLRVEEVVEVRFEVCQIIEDYFSKTIAERSEKMVV